MGASSRALVACRAEDEDWDDDEFDDDADDDFDEDDDDDLDEDDDDDDWDVARAVPLA